ncbi:uncharacterized protein LOC107841664 [Capsicum annuum]|uniref:uncharacterized protein LOC107841664 n=1 Tax=Capsicum annuum TaxID=4072 RepID=UPI001FB130E9|nr:uncharacterized protein LOC107841664 [Capsicum annuum]
MPTLFCIQPEEEQNVTKSVVDEVVDVELEESGPVESEMLDNSNNALDKVKEKEKEVVLKTILKPPPPFLERLKKKKKVDPRAFTIPCNIGSLNFTKELCDLGASIDLMPLAVYKKMVLGDPIPTNIQLVMEDKSVKWPVILLLDVLVKLSDFIMPADFVVLDCEMDFEVPIILNRPFLVTGRVIVDIELKELKFRFNNKEAGFKIHSSMTPVKEISVFSIVDVFYEDDKRVTTRCLGKV